MRTSVGGWFHRKQLFPTLLVWVLTWVYCSNNLNTYGSVNDDANVVVVDTKLGKIMGKKDGNVVSFLGIPFAEPPIGRYRFRPPRPKRPWYPSIYRAFSFSPECLQSSLYAAEDDDSRQKDEDCLYLNVWRPVKTKEKGLLPVLVWIYGGAFLHGGASRPEYVGDKIAARGIIVVSLNYRLGALGFLVSTSDGLYGNYGLADQKMAIQWVHEHIRSFGGDPERVTLFGESAGAMSVGLQLLDQQLQIDRKRLTSRKSANKLFHAIILQSNPLGYKYRSIAVANFIGNSYKEQLDCEDLRCLQSESPEELMHVQDSLMAVPRSIGDFFTWGPVVTDSSFYREARLRPGPLANMTVRQPMDAMKELRALDVPVIIGSNTHEGTVFVFTAFPTRMAKIIYQGLVFSFFRSSAPLVLKLYAPLSRRIADSPFPDYRLVLAQIIGDYLFRCPNQYFATLLTGVGTSVFLYEFALATRTPGFPCCDGLSCHTCELPYVFNQEYLIERDYLWNDFSSIRQDRGNFNGSETPAKDSIPDIFGASSTWIDEGDSGSYSEQSKHRFAIDKEVSRLMADYWSTFATFGDPNGQLTRNGYGSGTRPDNSPWWPNLHGTLPSDKATKDIEAQVKHKRPGKRNRISPMVGWLDYEDQDVDYPDNKSSEVEEEETSWRESIGSDRFDYSANKDDDDESDYDYPLNNLYKRRRKERADKIRRQEKKGLPRTNSPPWDKANHLDNDDEYDDSHKFMTGDEWTVDPDDSNPTSSGDYSLSRFTNSLSLNFKFNNKKSAIKRATRHNANNYMHQILFDRETAVNIIENDCICNTWNRLEYRF